MSDKRYKLLQKKSDIQTRLKLLPYSGSPEIRAINNKKYLYVRKRIAGKLTSVYAGEYSDELYQLLSKNSDEEKILEKELRETKKALEDVGYKSGSLSERVMMNIDFARANSKVNIYSQAVLEGIDVSFSQVEDIIENQKIHDVRANDVLKIINLKLAWDFILNEDFIVCDSDYALLCNIAAIVNEGFFPYGGRIRNVPVRIRSCSYIPPVPAEMDVIESIESIKHSCDDAADIAAELCLYCMKTQIFNDGNKRSAVIFANHFLISRGQGFLVIPAENVPEFRKMLVDYYEGKESSEIKQFMREVCWKNF